MTNKPIWTTALRPTNGWAGLWNQVYNEQHALIDGQNVRRGFGMSLRNWGRYAYNQTLYAFVTGTVGTVASAPSTWVAAHDPANLGSLGGKRNIATHYAINRAVTAADQTAIMQDIAFNNSPTWPVDKGGNGGGGKGGL